MLGSFLGRGFGEFFVDEVGNRPVENSTSAVPTKANHNALLSKHEPVIVEKCSFEAGHATKSERKRKSENVNREKRFEEGNTLNEES